MTQLATKLVIDLSYNDLATLDPACFLAHGVTGVILGTYDPVDPPNKMAQAADSCLRAGLCVEAFYGVTYFGNQAAVRRDCVWAIDLAREFRFAKELRMPLVFMDVEADACDEGWGGSRPSAPQRISELMDVRALIEGANLNAGVYAGEPFWDSQMAGNHAFSDLPLWYPNYGQIDGGAMLPIPSVDFGGWRAVWAHQFTSMWGVANDCGRMARDCSYLFEEVASMSDNDILACFGSTETDPLERLENARWRRNQAVAGTGKTLWDLAAEAKALLAPLSYVAKDGLAT